MVRSGPSPHDWISPKSKAPRLDLDTKIDLLCGLCQLQKPEHRREDTVKHPSTGDPFAFYPGKFLNCLIDHLLPNARDGKVKPLSCEQTSKLLSLHWFEEWRQGIVDARSVGVDGAEPDLGEKVRLMCEVYTKPQGFMEALPSRRRVVWSECLGPRTVTRERGMDYETHGFRLMEKLSANWFQAESKVPKSSKLTRELRERIEALPWFEQWRADGVHRRKVSLMRKVVTKEQKLEMLMKHYDRNLDGTPRSKPSWGDEIPVEHTAVRDDDGGLQSVWTFKPATFLDDLVDNWVVGGKPGVTLTDEQKEQMEQLPWVHEWLTSVLAARLRRRAQRCTSPDSCSSKRSRSPEQLLLSHAWRDA